MEDQFTPVRGLDILEIGGALPAELTIDQLGANSWTCVEKMDYWEQSNESVHKSRLKQSITQDGCTTMRVYLIGLME